MGVTPMILMGSVVIQNDPDTSISDPGSLTVVQYGAFGSYATVGTSLSVGTTITATGSITGSFLNLVSTNNTSTIAGPLSLSNTTTSTSSASFTYLNTTSSSFANTFNNPSTFSSSLTGVNSTFSSSVTAAFFNGSSSTLASTLQGPLAVSYLTTSSTSSTSTLNGPLSLTNTLNSTSSATFAGLLTANNKINTNGFLNTGASTLGGQVNYPNTFYTFTTPDTLSTSQSGAAVPGNVWRFRTNDTVNTAVRLSLGNAGLGNTFYNTNISVYGLGVIEGATGNSERLTIGYNGTSGPYINQQFLGTGITRPLNIYNGAIFSVGGALALASTLNVTSTSSLAGPVTAGTTLAVTGQTTFGAQCNYPNNYYTYTNSIPSLGNTFRFRSLDIANTAVINSLANAGVGPTVGYMSLLAFYSLGNTEANTTNTELMYVGANASGGVIAPGASGTGVLTKPLNIYGTTIVNNGLVTLPNGLTVTSGNTTLGGGTLAVTNTSELTSFSSQGGATLGKSLSLGGQLVIGSNSNVVTAIATPLNSSNGVLLTSLPITWIDTSTASSKTASGNYYGNYFGASTLTATNTSVTTPVASTLFIAGAPIASTNQTITNAYSAYFANGNIYCGATTTSSTPTIGALVVAGGAGFGATTSFGSNVNFQMVAQPATPTIANTETMWVNTSGLLQSMGPDGVITTYQPLTTSGDLLVYNGTTQTRLPKGADNTALIADSTVNVGVSWQTITRNNVIVGNTSTVPAPRYLVKLYTGTVSGNSGQIIVYPTTTNTSAGSKVFSTINFVSIYVVGNNGGTAAYQQFWGTVNAQNTTMIDCRILSGANIGTLLASVNPTLSYAPSGTAATIKVEGVPL